MGCISLDMGGTTAKASIVEGGTVAKTGDYEVGAGINLSSKLVMGGGLCAQAAGDRHLRDWRWRRLDRRHRCGRVDACRA